MIEEMFAVWNLDMLNGKAYDVLEKLREQLDEHSETYSNITVGPVCIYDNGDQGLILFGARDFTDEEIKKQQQDKLDERNNKTIDSIIEQTIDKLSSGDSE